nr:histidine phosphatase family protein [Neobacillus sp. Marseille-Q6967]
MQITLIRHLPTEWNKKTWLQGKRDIEIASINGDLCRGIAENKARLHRLAPFDLSLASTLKRTQQTAQLYGYHYETESLLDELDFGPFEGKPKEELLEAYGEMWTENPREMVLGERLTELEGRVVQFLEKYKDYSNLLVFGHGSWIRAFISYSEYGDINSMNKITVGNNACFTIEMK